MSKPPSPSYVDGVPDVLANPSSLQRLTPTLEVAFPYNETREWFGRRAGHAMVSIPEANTCLTLGGFTTGGALLPMDIRQYDFGVLLGDANDQYGRLSLWDPAQSVQVKVHPYSGTVGARSSPVNSFQLRDVDLSAAPVPRRSMCAVYARREQAVIVFGGVGSNPSGSTVGRNGTLLADAWRLQVLNSTGTHI